MAKTYRDNGKPRFRKVSSDTWACIGKYGWVFGKTISDAWTRFERVARDPMRKVA